ncbi:MULTISPECIES: molybdopterin converting factor subunit 1 [Pseudoalteromonas]|jgi:molybdopterin synthase sulfur carrier subunit|uniref:Molybdopterin synthase sulfur carrier subunit n=1 Tax=Pseudoalteromonas lipolytica TaxID=570156 RepID=A0AAD0S195_9GAMM|nr:MULTISPECIES: molybdopterin converting factor subunit 1 [Pseudoalteromonas]AXV66315.1 molybdopterin converting factor subunit 1 [Pseudoalteromonas donghaensis]MAE01142.1 molybdopterin converting factor subunit 1 [Pseudoalteromonas sp.]MBE0349801.1 molybdopterin synthase sulfur carrier subunit [Pseudoalteromonas lipolytica LMEB 39]MCC9660853.1 molybdopterin converting factor subunit 1 [Pseudoalteromonas sp. MB41]QLJ07842.1 molybdopterin converting factor subunit 1 [Pseudoalteromonas sp. JSTW|tara:strand:+ start:2665 stop:2910 length:246 start_codon:yes stop_codon:yes gene_type:complete
MNKVLFFAQLRERLGCDSVQLDAQGMSVRQLRQTLAERDERWHTWLLDKDVLVAVNQILVDDNAAVGTGDEVAMFPPVTGG